MYKMIAVGLFLLWTAILFVPVLRPVFEMLSAILSGGLVGWSCVQIFQYED